VILSTRVRGAGRPIVALPWFSLDQAVMAAAFEPVFAATAGWRRIYVDLPGTGASAPVEPRSDAVLDAVLDTVESVLGNERFLLAGCSYGGYLAAGITRRIPAQVAGLLLVCAGVKIRRADRNLDGVLASEPEPGWLRDIPEELHDHFSHAIGAQTSAVATRVADAFSLNGPINDDYLTVLQSDGYPLSDEGSPHDFGGHVTIVTGRRDRIAGYLDQFGTVARYPRGNFIALGDAGHYLPFEEPGCFESVTLDWLAQAERTVG
jgi:pimeloyl-ACP methyl ester carboxylesterase